MTVFIFASLRVRRKKAKMSLLEEFWKFLKKGKTICLNLVILFGESVFSQIPACIGQGELFESDHVQEIEP